MRALSPFTCSFLLPKVSSQSRARLSWKFGSHGSKAKAGLVQVITAKDIRVKVTYLRTRIFLLNVPIKVDVLFPWFLPISFILTTEHKNFQIHFFFVHLFWLIYFYMAPSETSPCPPRCSVKKAPKGGHPLLLPPGTPKSLQRNTSTASKNELFLMILGHFS